MSQLAPATAAAVQHYACSVVGVTPLSPSTCQVDLLAPEGATLDYRAGQYLQLALVLEEGEAPQLLSYSIANRMNPNAPRSLQIFIHNSSAYTATILAHLAEKSRRNAPIDVVLPRGRAFLQSDLNAPHILVAAGSGISKIKCLTEDILKRNPAASVRIYWSNKRIDDFYLLRQFLRWAAEHDGVTFTPILESADPLWAGRSGYIYTVIEKDLSTLRGAHAYLCGSPQMVYGTIDKLAARGLDEANCYSDVFEYAPRNRQEAS